MELSGTFFLHIFDLWLVESLDVEAVDTEDQQYIIFSSQKYLNKTLCFPPKLESPEENYTKNGHGSRWGGKKIIEFY